MTFCCIADQEEHDYQAAPRIQVTEKWRAKYQFARGKIMFLGHWITTQVVGPARSKPFWKCQSQPALSISEILGQGPASSDIMHTTTERSSVWEDRMVGNHQNNKNLFRSWGQRSAHTDSLLHTQPMQNQCQLLQSWGHSDPETAREWCLEASCVHF